MSGQIVTLSFNLRKAQNTLQFKIQGSLCNQRTNAVHNTFKRMRKQRELLDTKYARNVYANYGRSNPPATFR